MKNIEGIMKRYFEIFSEDKKDLKVLISQLNTIKKKDIFDRKNMTGHIVANSLVINNKNEILSIFHKNLGMYIQPGGHVDPEDNSVLCAAKRELEEETGIKNFNILEWDEKVETPIFIESHKIPVNNKKKEGEHWHHDFMYIFRVDNPKIYLQLNEVTDFKWIPVKEILKNSDDGFIERSLLRMKKREEKIKFTKENNPFSEQGIFLEEDWENLFDFKGVVRIPKDRFEDMLEKDENIKEYYGVDGTCSFKKSSENAEVFLNGYRSYVALDKNLRSESIINILEEDIKSGIKTLKKIENNEVEIDSENRVFYFSIVQAAKNAALTIFNALIIKEKKGEFRIKDARYQGYRSWLDSFLSDITEKAYSILLDAKQKNDNSSLDNMELFEEVMEYMKKNSKMSHFSRPEATHPLSMMGGVLNVVKKYPETETIISVPSGGTEIAIMQGLAYEKILGTNPEKIIIPLSRHSIKDLDGDGDIFSSDFSKYLNSKKYFLKDKTVLVVDDNSSTGGTMNEIKKILDNYGVEKVDFLVSEADIIRSELDIYNEKRENIANPYIYDAATQVLPVSRNIKPKTDLKEISELNIIKSFYKEKVEKSENLSLIEKIKNKILYDNLDTNFSDVFYDEENITSFRKTYFSNFAPVDISYNNNIYPSVEHAYMAAKFKNDMLISDKIKNNKIVYFLINKLLANRGIDEKVTEKNIDNIFVNKEYDAGTIKLITNIISDYVPIRADWNEVQLEVMIDFLIQKYNDSFYKDLLKNTEEKVLIEGTDWDDVYWGVSNKDGNGNNFLGRILMEIRKK